MFMRVLYCSCLQLAPFFPPVFRECGGGTCGWFNFVNGHILLQFYSYVSPKAAAINMDLRFLDRNVNEGFSGGEKKRNEILQLAVWNLIFVLGNELQLFN